MNSTEKYVRDVLKEEPNYRHYANDVKVLLRVITELRNELIRCNKAIRVTKKDRKLAQKEILRRIKEIKGNI